MEMILRIVEDDFKIASFTLRSSSGEGRIEK